MHLELHPWRWERRPDWISSSSCWRVPTPTWVSVKISKSHNYTLFNTHFIVCICYWSHPVSVIGHLLLSNIISQRCLLRRALREKGTKHTKELLLSKSNTEQDEWWLWFELSDYNLSQLFSCWIISRSAEQLSLKVFPSGPLTSGSDASLKLGGWGWWGWDLNLFCPPMSLLKSFFLGHVGGRYKQQRWWECWKRNCYFRLPGVVLSEPSVLQAHCCDQAFKHTSELSEKTKPSRASAFARHGALSVTVQLRERVLSSYHQVKLKRYLELGWPWVTCWCRSRVLEHVTCLWNALFLLLLLLLLLFMFTSHKCVFKQDNKLGLLL